VNGVKEIVYKISASPSQSLLIWIGAFILGIGAATCVFPVGQRPFALPAAVACLLIVAACGRIIKNKEARLSCLAGFCLIGGFCRYLSADSDLIDLLKYLPALAAAKAWLVASVGRLLPEPQAGLLNGLLVGGGLRSPELRAAFIATGTAHVMALSGYNITMVGRWLERILDALRFGRQLRWLGVSLGLVAFTIMTGAASSLVRAAAMNVIMTVGLACGRRSDQGRLLVYAASAMLIVTPTLLRTDLGFLLSIAAMLGLIYLAPIIEPFAAFLPKRFNIAKTAAETAAATVATLPVALVAFGQVSVVALPANLLLLPFVAATIAVGFLAAGIAGIVPQASAALGFLISIFTDYDISLVRLLSRIPGALMTEIVFGPLAAVLMSVGLVYVAAKHYASSRQEKTA
jgi:ComEC/Rec2-related protein